MKLWLNNRVRYNLLTNSSILVTGGTGSFGHTFIPMTLEKYNPKRLVIYSRDEMKQWEMAKLYVDDDRVRFFIGDVREKDRLSRALDGVDYVIAPFVRAEDIRHGLIVLEETDCDYAFSVTTYAFPIQRAISINPDGRVENVPAGTLQYPFAGPERGLP